MRTVLPGPGSAHATCRAIEEAHGWACLDVLPGLPPLPNATAGVVRRAATELPMDADPAAWNVDALAGAVSLCFRELKITSAFVAGWKKPLMEKFLLRLAEQAP